jgi:outer membrane protein insertion porin family
MPLAGSGSHVSQASGSLVRRQRYGHAPVALLLAAGLLLSCILGFPRAAAGQEPAQITIREVRFEGLVRMPPESLTGALGIESGQKIVRSALPGRVRAAIRSLFASGSFTDVRVYMKDGGEDGITLTFVLEEKYVVRKVQLTGNDEIEEEDLRKSLTVREGRFLDTGKLMESVTSIHEAYHDKGFYLADVGYVVEKDEATRSVVVTIQISEGFEPEIRRVSFVGNREISDDELKAFMQTRETNYLSFLGKGGLFFDFGFSVLSGQEVGGAGAGAYDSGTDMQFWSTHKDMDLQRLKWLYMTRGMVDAKLGEPRLALTPDNKGIVITVDVQEGPKYTVGKVDILCQDEDGMLVDKEELAKELVLKSGETFNSENVMRDTKRMSGRYLDLGYAFANVSNTPYLDRKNRILDLTYTIEKGVPTYIANIEVEGNKTTADKVLRREMKIREGDLYSQSKIDRSKALITRLGFFETVEISNRPALAPPRWRPVGASDDDVGFVDLVIKVKEKDTGIFQVGAGFSSLESYLLQARIAKNNFLGRGQTLSFQALMSSLRQIYMISFVEPYFLDTLWSFSFDLYDTVTDYDEFTTEATGGNVSWGYRFFDDYFVYLTYKLEQMQTTLGGRLGRSSTPLELLLDSGLTSSMRLSVAWDTRNNRIVPTDGYYHSVSAEWASPYFGGESDFYRYMGNTRWYIPLVWDFILRVNGTLGYIGTTSTEGVPLFERFYVGGIFNVRGFQRNSLSPTIPVASDKDPGAALVPFKLGGNKELIFNTEIEIPIFREMGIVGVVFLDAGNAFAEDEALSLAELRTSAGFGFRWWSPMGPLRFEWGFPLAPEPNEEPYVFEFTIGSAF